jgi:hypothetical protein
MNDAWLEISDDAIDVGEIMQQIRERIARRAGHPRRVYYAGQYAAREEAGLPAFDVLQQVTEALANLRAKVWRRSSGPQASGEPGEKRL